jgi:heme exporter protein A
MSASADTCSLTATGLQCVRGERQLFSGISFELQKGTLLKIEGPNGSGKTSLLRILCGLLPPAAGEIAWNGRRIHELAETYHASLAYVGHLNAVKDELTARENLALSARLAGLSAAAAEIAEALARFGLSGSEHLPCKLLSQGQKRRAALARLHLCVERKLWVLDEPFTALDGPGVRLTRSLIEAHLGAGAIVVLTTHQEVEVTAPAIQRIELRS